MDVYARPRLLTSAPPDVVEFVREIVGGRVLREEPASDGFTPSVASIVVADGTRQVFVKAGPASDDAGQAVRTGAELSEVITDLAPALIGWAERGGWYVAVYERLAGAAVLRWEANDIAELSTLAATMRERLSPSPIVDTEPFADGFAPLLGTWRALVDPGDPMRETVEHVRTRKVPYGLRAETLAELEADWFWALRAGSALQHGDIRRDNVMREPSGRLRLVDWTHLWTAPSWADWVRLVPDLAADGFDPQVAFETIGRSDANEREVNVMLAGLAGRCWRDGHLDAVPGLPQLRPMQRLQGDMTLRWLAQRGVR
ncbi:phosphotransferase [Agreia pratensis]|uniref:phosphotransferase n=1 Tax=Agreia pratensis TaxID=150121 RepID=UPI00188A57F8|nr:phosphotransferase [Agreia pratensis]MBF4633421.1 phosphotransferase [Agreia pratensis]